MAKVNKSRYAVLGMLALGPASGYEIKKHMEESTANFWSESYGQIYPILKQLTDEGLAISHAEKQAGKPERYVYTLTDQGQHELVNWLVTPVEQAVERCEILLKLFFGKVVPLKENIEHIRRFQLLQQELLVKYRQIEAMLQTYIQEDKPNTLHHTYSLITVRYGIHEHQALLAWCEESLATLDKISMEGGAY